MGFYVMEIFSTVKNSMCLHLFASIWYSEMCELQELDFSVHVPFLVVLL